MKKNSLIMGFLVVLIGVVLIGATSVYAEDLDAIINNETDGNSFVLIGDDDVNSTPAQNTTPPKNNTNTSKNNTNTSNKNNTNTSNKNNTNTSNKNNTNTNNVSNYNNTNNTPNSLSKAGIEDHIPTMVLIVIFAISAIYAFKKINDYKNV